MKDFLDLLRARPNHLATISRLRWQPKMWLRSKRTMDWLTADRAAKLMTSDDAKLDALEARAAALYTLIETAKLNRSDREECTIKPWDRTLRSWFVAGR